MKINWGTGIVITFVLFISFILFFVVKATTQKEYAYDLVDEEYYKTELSYQDEIDKLENTKGLEEKIEIVKVEDGIEINFPSMFNAENTSGVVAFYRPSTKVLDFKLPISILETKMLIPKDKLIAGNWNIVIDFGANSTNYLFKKTFSY